MTSYTGTGIDGPFGITWGPDGALWFVNVANNSIGRITTAGTVSNFPSTAIDEPISIVAGPDGALWFTEDTGDAIGRITTGGTVSTYPLATGEDPYGITVGPDGNLWFTDSAGDSIGRITPAGVISTFTGAGIDDPIGITSGPDGNLWFTNAGNNSIGSISTSGMVSNYTGTGIERPWGITAGPDGALWFTDQGALRTFVGSAIGRITTSGAVSTFTSSTIDGPIGITTGPDGALWFTNAVNSSIGSVTTTGTVTNFPNTTTQLNIDGPDGITSGPDGALWFANGNGNSIGTITTSGTITADGSATCGGLYGQTSFSPPLSTTSTSASETATTTVSLSDCDQEGNDDVSPSSVTGTLTSTTTYSSNSCATFLAGGSSTSTVDWTGADPEPAYPIASTTLSATGTASADDQNPSGDLGIQQTGVTSTGSYFGPGGVTFFFGSTPSEFSSDCGASGGLASLLITGGVVSAGMAVSGPVVTSASSASFTEGTPGSFAVALSDPLQSTITCSGNMPPGLLFQADANGTGGQITGTPLPGTAGTYPLTIIAVDSADLSTSQAFTLTVATSSVPYVSGVSPDSGTNTLVPVTITGQNFTGATTVDFGSIPATDVDVESPTSISVEEPAGSAAGPVDVTVTSPSGTSVADTSDQFTYDLPPQPPSVTSVDTEGLGMLVSWAPNPTADDVTTYTVTATVASGYTGSVPSGCSDPAPVSVPETDTGATVAGLCAGIPYVATVTATNSYGTSDGPQEGSSDTAGSTDEATEGAPSAPVVPLPAQAPSSPLITSVVPGARALTVTWSPPSQLGGDPLTGYVITATSTTGLAVTKTVPATDASYEMKKLTDGVEYTVTLTAVSAAGTSPGDSMTGTPEAVIAPGEPAGIQVEPNGQGDLVVTWLPPTTSGTKKIKDYELAWGVSTQAAPLTAQRSGRRLTKGTPGFAKIKATVRSYTITGLSGDSYYSIGIEAVSSAGTGPQRAIPTPVTPQVVLNPGTVELETATIAAMTSDGDGVDTWPSPVPAQLSGLTSGDILAAPASTTLPDGMLAQVQGVYPTASGGITVYTSLASPSQAFLTFTFAISGMSPSAVPETLQPTSAGVRATADLGVGVGNSGTLGLDFGNCGGDDVSLCLNATMYYALDAGANLDTFCAGASIAGNCIGVPIPDGVTIYANADLSAGASVVFDTTQTQQYQLANQILGVIPIFLGLVITPTVTATLNLSGTLAFSADANGGFGGGFSCSASLTSGAGCSGTNPGELEFAPTGSATANIDASGSATLEGEGEVCLDVVACANIAGDLTLTGTLNTRATPFLTICATVAARAGVNLNLIIHNFNWDTTIWSDQIGCSSQANPPPSLEVTASVPSSSPCDVSLGKQIQQLTATRSDGASDPPITWSLENGIPGDSISSTGTSTAELTTASPGNRNLIIKATDSTGLSGVLTCTVGNLVAFTPPIDLTFSVPFRSIGPNGLDEIPEIGQELISWQPPLNDGGASVDNYRVCLTGVSDTTCISTNGATQDQVSIYEDPGTADYHVQVWAINADFGGSQPAVGTFAGVGPSISSMTVAPYGYSQELTVSGQGFGNQPAGAASPAGCGGTGYDYADDSLLVKDVSPDGTSWSAGSGTNCIGDIVVSYTDSQVVIVLGSYYGTEPKYMIQPGDSLTVVVNGAEYQETVSG